MSFRSAGDYLHDDEGCGVTFKIVCVSSQKAGKGGRTMMKQRKKTCESKRPKGNKNVTEFQIEH